MERKIVRTLLKPSKESLEAIKRLNSGQGIKMSLDDFTRQLIKVFPHAEKELLKNLALDKENDMESPEIQEKLRLTLPWESVEDSAKEQIEKLLRNPTLETLVVLPDVHWGMHGKQHGPASWL